MTTDKTLADVQPGGRVRLGDANIASGLRNMLSDIEHFGAAPITVDTNLIRDAIAALSAQPSPGGQGDAPLRVFSAGRWTYDGTGQSFSHEDMDAVAFVVYRDAALSARQPVGEPLWCLHVLGMDDVHPAPSKAHAEKAAAWHNEQFKDQAARLGISIEAKVVPWPHSAESHAAGVAEFIPQWLIPQWQLDALEAKADQPAQAVDLGAVRALLQRRIEQWRSHLPSDPDAPGTREIVTKGECDYNNDVAIYRQGIAVMEEVLFKIDSKAAGNG